MIIIQLLLRFGVLRMSIQSEAAGLVQRHKDNIGYLEKFGSPIEKAMVQVVLAAARGDISEGDTTKTRAEYQYFNTPESRSYRDNR
jgi:hypothetical protein